MTGKSVAQLQNMNEAEHQALAQQMVTQRLSAAGKKPQAQAQKAMSQMEVTNDMKRITDRWQEIDRLNEKEKWEVAAQFPALYRKHGIQAAFEAAAPCMDGKIDTEKYSKTYCKNAAKRLEAARNAYYTECYTLWRNPSEITN